ncbi:hypothetical protein L210DRAFT_602369 [Boletus edulis BED1]|uniref:F-box domain-containing protein n=1 Tax=Boletus edulis BED1 TaxID=1328754 RepID=A0AAD4GCE3_BOLED|nr:hypothetical protein L210DRAFT_602369 [Boletus edulis BED1]
MNSLYSASSHRTYDMVMMAAIERMNEGIGVIRQTSASSNLYVQTKPPCSIHCLPTEILEAIFIYCACEYHDTTTGKPIPTAPSWVNVSCVSRRWRTVALNCHILWTYLFITSPRWTEELLARSKQAPLKLCVDTGFHWENWLDSVEQVMDHVERIQQLQLCISKSFENHHIISKLTSPAPCLQILELSVECFSSDWPSLPFGGNTPSLRTLVLSGCPVPWYSFKLSGLKHLILKQIPVEFQQNTAEFLATLSCMQDLTLLHLHNALASATGFLSSTTFHTFQKFNLSHLSRLMISAPLSTIIALLCCVNIPLKAMVVLDCGIEENFSSPAHYALLYPLLAQRFSLSEDWAFNRPTIRSLNITSHWHYADVIFSTSDREPSVVNHWDVSELEWDCNIPLQIILSFSYSMTRRNIERIVSRICCSIPLPDVQRVRACSPPLSATFWMDVLSHLQGLRSLKLSRGYMPQIASILSLAPDNRAEEGGHQNPSRLLAPALEELELYDILFSKAVESYHDVDRLEVADVQSLHDALSTRKDTRVRLTMTGCNGCDPGTRKKEFTSVRCCVVM